jgi:hypothetical protein
MPDRIGVAVCRHLLQEASEVCRQRGLTGVTVLALPSQCDRPWPNWPALLAALQPGLADSADLIVVGAVCLPDEPPPDGPVRVRVVRSSTGFAILTNETMVDAWTSRGCYLVTPGWVRQWREQVAEWGYDQAAARQHFGEFARTVLLLDTGVDPAAPAHLREFAEFLGLDHDTQPVGLDVFSDRVTHAVAEAASSRQLDVSRARSAEATMLLDLSGKLIGLGHESDVFERILGVVRTLLPDHRSAAASVRHGSMLEVVGDSDPHLRKHLQAHVRSPRALAFLPDEAGFAIQFRNVGEVVGVMAVTAVAIPASIPQYANLLAALAGVCAAAIVRARMLSGVIPICSGCKSIRDSTGSWQSVDLYVREHSEAEFTHGLCPTCAERLYPGFSGG